MIDKIVLVLLGVVRVLGSQVLQMNQSFDPEKRVESC